MTRRLLHHAILAALVVASVAACGGENGSTNGAPAKATGAPAPATTKAADPGHEGHDHARRTERPLPAFSGYTLDGDRLDVGSLIGKRLVLFFFNPEVDEAKVVARAMGRISKLRGKQNFEIVGIATGSRRDTVDAFARDFGIDYRVIDDSSVSIARRLGMRYPVAMLGVDAEGVPVMLKEIWHAKH